MAWMSSAKSSSRVEVVLECLERASHLLYGPSYREASRRGKRQVSVHARGNTNGPGHLDKLFQGARRVRSKHGVRCMASHELSIFLMPC